MRPSKLRLPLSTEQTARSCLVDRGADLVGQRAGVADARRAAVADEVEAELLERLGQPGAVEVLGHHLGPRRQRRLDPRLARQPARHGVAGQQAGAEHDRRVGGVGARRDGGDDDVPVVELERLAVERHLGRGVGVLGDHGPRRHRGRRGGRVRVGLVARRAVGRRVGGREGLGDRLVVAVGDLLLGVAGRRGRPAPRGRRPWRRAARTRSCGRLGPASEGTTSPRSSSTVSEKVGSSAFSSCQRPCSLA